MVWPAIRGDAFALFYAWGTPRVDLLGDPMNRHCVCELKMVVVFATTTVALPGSGASNAESLSV